MKPRLFLIVFSALLLIAVSSRAFAVLWSMTGATNFGAGANPVSVAVADFNGDGIPDIAVADKNTAGTIAILIAKPTGGFYKTKTVRAGSNPVCVVTGDFTGRGKTDLAVADWDNREVRVIPGNGDGTFDVPDTKITTGLDTNPVHMRAADLNGDGKLDLVVANYNSRTISVLLGNGDGTFQPPVDYTVGANPRHVCIADFNHDGIPDIAVTLWGDNKVAVLLGNGDGTFQAPSTFPTGKNPLGVEAADLNGDGNIDLAVGIFNNDRIQILDGDGTGNFTTPPAPQAGFGNLTSPQPYLAAPSGPQEMVIGDFDGDGKPDIAVAGGLGNAVWIYSGRGDGTFQGRRALAAGSYPAGLASGDFYRDGMPGLVTANMLGNNVSVYRPSATAVGFWSYTTVPPISLTTGVNPSGLLADDFNYDGVMDMAVANKDSNSITVFLNRRFTFGTMSGLFGNFTAVTTPAPGAPPSFASLSTISAPSGIASGVFTNSTSLLHPADYRAGLAVANSGNNTVAILLPNGGGTFRPITSINSPQLLKTGINSPSAIKTADFNKDNKTDIAVCNAGDNSVTIYLGKGDGTFTYKANYPLGQATGPLSMTIGDYNKDGHLDIAVADQTSGTVSILFGKGDGTFKLAKKSYPAGSLPSSIAATPGGNIVFSDAGSNTASFLANNGSGGFSLSKTIFNVGASPSGILVQDVTDDRVLDLVTANSGSNDISLIQGQATGGFSKNIVNFPAGTSPVALVAHDFTGGGAMDLAVLDAGTPPNPGGVTILIGQDIAYLTVEINNPAFGSVTVSPETYPVSAPATVTASSEVLQEEGGKEIELTANPAPGYTFSHWSGAISGGKNPAFITMNAKTKTLKAVFVAQ